MSSHEELMTQDGFTIVRGRNFKKKKRDQNQSSSHQTHFKSELISSKNVATLKSHSELLPVSDYTINQVLKLKSQIKSSSFWSNFLEYLDPTSTNAFSSISPSSLRTSFYEINRVVCLGLGTLHSTNFSENSRTQLALLLLLIDEIVQLKVSASNNKLSLEDPPSSFLELATCDPIYTDCDMAVLNSFGFRQIENCCGSYSSSKPLPYLDNDQKSHPTIATVTHQQPIEVLESSSHSRSAKTLFFSPHCPIEIYSNLLAENWTEDDFSNIIVIGNGFTQMTEMRSQNDMKFSKLREASRLVVQIPLPTYEKQPFILSDTFVQLAEQKLVKNANPDIWKVSEKK